MGAPRPGAPTVTRTWCRTCSCGWTERIFLHTARQRGHFLANVEFCERVCFEADQPGETFPYGPVECDTSIAFRSVVVFGRIRIVSEPDTSGDSSPRSCRSTRRRLPGDALEVAFPRIGLDHPLLDRPGDHDGQADPAPCRRETLATRGLTRRCTFLSTPRAAAAAGSTSRPPALGPAPVQQSFRYSGSKSLMRAPIS